MVRPSAQTYQRSKQRQKLPGSECWCKPSGWIRHELCIQMRLKSTLPGLIMLPILVLGFGWLCDKVQNVAAISFFLFIGGFVYMFVQLSLYSWRYSDCLDLQLDLFEYTGLCRWCKCRTIVDCRRSEQRIPWYICLHCYGNCCSSPGMSLFWCQWLNFIQPFSDRMVSVMVGSLSLSFREMEIILKSQFSGWMYTIWTGILLLNSVIVLLVWMKGTQWRENAEAREKRHAARFESATFSSTRSITPPNWWASQLYLYHRKIQERRCS